MRISDWSSDVCSSDLAVGVEQGAKRRILDRPALHLIDLIIDHRQPAAVADDQQRHALLILKADLAVALQSQRARQPLAVAVGLDEIGDHRGGRLRYEERREGKEWVSRWRSRWSPSY